MRAEPVPVTVEPSVTSCIITLPPSDTTRVPRPELPTLPKLAVVQREPAPLIVAVPVELANRPR
jgi:hypothetical protein